MSDQGRNSSPTTICNDRLATESPLRSSILDWVTLPFSSRQVSSPAQSVDSSTDKPPQAEPETDTDIPATHERGPEQDEEKIGLIELNKLLQEIHQSYKKEHSAMEEELRLKDQELASIRILRVSDSAATQTDSGTHGMNGLKRELADAVARATELQDAFDKLTAKHSLLLLSSGKTPPSSPSISRGIVNLTRECTEIRRYCEAESKAKKILQAENAQLCAKLTEKVQLSDNEASLKKELAIARLDLKRALEANDELRADCDRLQKEALENSDRVADEMNELTSECADTQKQLSKVCALYEELQVTSESRLVLEKERYERLVEKYCNLQDALDGKRNMPSPRTSSIDSPPRRASYDSYHAQYKYDSYGGYENPVGPSGGNLYFKSALKPALKKKT